MINSDDTEVIRVLGPLDPYERAREIAELRGRLETARIVAGRSSTPTVIAVLAVGVATGFTVDLHDQIVLGIVIAATLLVVVLAGLLMREHRSALAEVERLARLIAAHEEAIRLDTAEASASNTPHQAQPAATPTSDVTTTSGRLRRALRELLRPH